MEIKDSKMKDFAQLIATTVATAVIETLEKGKYISRNENEGHKTKSAYQKTEQLLYNYNNFLKIIKQKELEIETIRTCGVPKKSLSILEYSAKSGTVGGTITEEESIECAIANVQRSVQGTVQAIALIDKCLDELKADPYYDILPMRYLEGRTQEDIAAYYGVSQVSISKNKTRLVKELSIRLFPDQAINEMLN